MALPFENVDYEEWLDGSTESARAASTLLMDAIAPKSVVDVGCGLGAWLAVMHEHGVDDVLGYDGPWVDRSLLLIAPGEYRVADLSEPLSAERRFELALCLEVAHLLEPEQAASLVDTLVALADVVVFGAAIPGQGGLHHVNEQWPRYWWELFSVRGYVATDPFRAALWEQPDVKWWFAQNMVCYARADALERLPALAEHRCEAAPLPLVHPGCLESAIAAREAVETKPARRRWSLGVR